MSAIVRDEDIRSGSPRIEGTRIAVHDIKRRVIDGGEDPFAVATEYEIDTRSSEHGSSTGPSRRIGTPNTTIWTSEVHSLIMVAIDPFNKPTHLVESRSSSYLVFDPVELDEPLIR
ncbi:DUF433 domain-containing protein [Halapricum hydrolyticum]|uniref:DUF433 domain-containing protein n=1 Tax=Halapricum hydrolyticum TaxID=2979991 RepID=A0AAE3I9G2_9EURY|nr:DUF433 domain-containing protein [Halapricum hydrolyticum]MCU4718171.1 DUF433 domain-containing protein [Halapricum hydrolyticum]MCU4726388.1 DUF433 domain-containing protein [Halapricum hydrolyticum]